MRRSHDYKSNGKDQEIESLKKEADDLRKTACTLGPKIERALAALEEPRGNPTP